MRRFQIAPGVHLSYDAAQKFNRCRISIHFAFPARRETATAHALLPLVMERGYADCPDMTQMTKKLARLYGADLTVDARPMGCSHNLCVSITGIKDQFALEGEKLTQEYAALALGTAFHPYFVGSTFDPEAVGIEKQMLKKALEDEVNDKRLYCQRQANREFFGDSPAGVRQEGYLEEVDGLTPEALTEAYDEMLRTANIELIVLGCDEASTTAVKDALLAELSAIDRAPLPRAENIAMPRRETTVGRGHRDFTVEEDPWLGPERAARRRDFTVNAILQDALMGEIVDPFGGEVDLRRGILRATPGEGFCDDPLRVLRGAQFASRFHLSPDEETLARMRTMKTNRLNAWTKKRRKMSRGVMQCRKP